MRIGGRTFHSLVLEQQCMKARWYFQRPGAGGHSKLQSEDYGAPTPQSAKPYGHIVLRPSQFDGERL